MIIVMIMRTRTAAVAEVAEEAAVEAEWWWRWSFVIEQTCVSRASGRGGSSGSNVICDAMLTQVQARLQSACPQFAAHGDPCNDAWRLEDAGISCDLT